MLIVVVKEAKNLDLDRILTPVKHEQLEKLLTLSGYDTNKMKFLTQGFKYGFKLQYEGNLEKARRFAPNLKLRVGSPTELWNKVMNEVELGRFAGPYESPPFEYFIQSPIGLVPKDKGKKTRLIFHLSYTKDEDSVNSGIPHNKCTVKYPNYDQAVKLCLTEGRGCYIGKSDMSSAFRHVPMAPSQWYLLAMKATHPVTEKVWYFVCIYPCHLEVLSAVLFSRQFWMLLHG